MFCLAFGITPAALENTRETPDTTAYGAYLLDIGLQGLSNSLCVPLDLISILLLLGDTTKLLMALLACLLGYGEVGLWLKRQALLPNSWVVLENNPYKAWMDDYAGEMYQGAVQVGLG